MSGFIDQLGEERDANKGASLSKVPPGQRRTLQLSHDPWQVEEASRLTFGSIGRGGGGRDGLGEVGERRADVLRREGEMRE